MQPDLEHPGSYLSCSQTKPPPIPRGPGTGLEEAEDGAVPASHVGLEETASVLSEDTRYVSEWWNVGSILPPELFLHGRQRG